MIEHARKVNWVHGETVNATIVLTRHGYDVFSKRAIERGIFPRFFLGFGQRETTGLCLPDAKTAMIWSPEPLPQIIERIGQIAQHNFCGVRHERSERGGSVYSYGFRIGLDWYQSGGAQPVLLPPEVRPPAAMIGVAGDLL